MSINSHLENISIEAYISEKEKLSINTSIETLQRRLKLYFSDDLKNIYSLLIFRSFCLLKYNSISTLFLANVELLICFF